MRHHEQADVEHYRQLLRGVVNDRPWVCAMSVLVAAAAQAKTIKSLGGDVLALGVTRGTGPVDAELASTGRALDLSTELSPSATYDIARSQTPMMDALRRAELVLENLPETIRHRVDAFDPKSEARIVTDLFSSDRPVAGRHVFGARPASWRRLEDKTLIDAFWDAAGIARAPSSVALVNQATTASERLSGSAGAVWAGDNQQGHHGGASMVRWVRSEGDAERAVAFFEPRCERVRVMPFLEGIPCSIHGWVFEQTTISFRPCEMLVFETADRDRLRYAGAATHWQPLPATTTAMQKAAKLAGDHLRETVGYAGVFTLDGVATKDGFFPTELNPRFGGAISRLAESLPELPLYLLHRATAEGLPLDFQPERLARLVCDAAESNPVAKGMLMLFDGKERTPDRRDLAVDDGELVVASPGQPVVAELELGPAPTGSLVFAKLRCEHFARHRSVAPWIAKAFEVARTEWDLPFVALKAFTDAERAEAG